MVEQSGPTDLVPEAGIGPGEFVLRAGPVSPLFERGDPGPGCGLEDGG